MSTVSTMNTMNTMNTTNSLTIKGLIGKEFLYDENLFISNYNPFVTTNTSGINGLYPDTTLTGKLYIFNKKEYKEPSKEEFQNIKSISELTTAPYRLINESTFNYLSVSILSKYNENSKERTFQLIKENSVGDINPILSNGLSINDFLYNPENNNLGSFAILVIDHSTETGKLNKKTYTDLAVGEQFLMYLIPSELINISESGTDSTKLISLTLSDASKLVLSEFGNYPDESVENKIDQRTNFFPNKFGIRIKEELYKNLFVKQNQVLEAYGETIKFVNTSDLTKPITIEEITRPVALPVNADIFLKWMEELSTETFFDKYNDYRYFAGSYDVGKDFSLVIPELIFNILYTRDLYELNKEIFKMYLISNPPSQETDPEMIINEDYIDTILYCFYRCRVGKDGSYISNKNALVFGANGLALPDISSIEYSSKIVDYGFIFFPQRHKSNEQAGKNKLANLPSIPPSTNYLEKTKNVSSCSIDPKVPEEEIKKYLNAAYLKEFDYFIAPNGNDSNSGRTIYTPKKTVASCPAGSKILLLPGEYGSAIGTLGLPNTYYSPAIINSDNRNVFGCGSLTKIKVLIPTEISAQRLRIFSGTNLSGSVSNMDIYINTNTEYTYSFGLVHWREPSHIFTFKLKNINFILNKPILRVASDGHNPGKTIFENCTFTHADVSSSYTGPKEYRTVANTPLDNILINDPESILVSDKTLINNIKQSYTFKPMYTLIPLNEGQNEDNQSKTINLETTRNISKIPNLNYKLS